MAKKVPKAQPVNKGGRPKMGQDLRELSAVLAAHVSGEKAAPRWAKARARELGIDIHRMPRPPKVQLNVRVPESVRDHITAMAKDRGFQNAGDFVLDLLTRTLLREHRKRNREGLEGKSTVPASKKPHKP